MMNHEKIIKTILTKFKLNRESKKIIYVTISHKMGYSNVIYYKIENGMTRLKMEDYFLICEILEIDPVALLKDAVEMSGME